MGFATESMDFIYLSIIDLPIIINVSFSCIIQLSYSSTQNITVLRFVGKGHSVWDAHYHNCWFTGSLCHQPISRYIFLLIKNTALIFEYPIFIKVYNINISQTYQVFWTSESSAHGWLTFPHICVEAACQQRYLLSKKGSRLLWTMCILKSDSYD